MDTAAAEPTLAEQLREAGLRATASRVALLSAVRDDKRHPTAEQLHETLRGTHSTISLSTVYDGLDAFVRAGLCRRVATGDGRLRVDGLVEDHDHAVCRSCGTIFDISPQRYPRPSRLPRLPAGLTPLGVRIEYDVICAACREGGPADGNHPGRVEGDEPHA